MSDSVHKHVVLSIQAQIGEAFTPTVLQTGARVAAQRYQQIVIARTLAGYDATGRRLAALKENYRKEKFKRLRMTRPTGRYSATEPGNVLRFRGRLLRGIRISNVRGYQNARGEMVAEFDIGFTDPRLQKIAQGLTSGRLGRAVRPGRPFIGLCPENTARGRNERREVIGAFTQYIASQTRRKGLIVEVSY